MRLAKKVFNLFFPALAIASVCFSFQLSSAFLLGAMLDQGTVGQFLWLLPLFCLLLFSVMTVAVMVLVSDNTDGYRVARLMISPVFLVFYSLIAACFFCFALFGILSLVPGDTFLRHTGLSAIALSVSVLVIDGIGFYGAIATRSKRK